MGGGDHGGREGSRDGGTIKGRRDGGRNWSYEER
jgi:hypothetical protein